MRGGRGHAGRLSRRDALATVTDTDRRPLTLLSEQRVLTQTQLERLLADTPARTLRYRTERLTKLDLVGRSRPYRDKGSAPFHYWPTRASDAFVRGEPVPRGGERVEPNPQFLHHAERLSELYVLLCVQAPTVGLHLHEFKREGEAREAFRADGRERALAPDALVHLHDDNRRGLLAFVELDMGTMSHARLKTKAAGYAAYAAQAAWTGSHPFCPCLLFLTTTETRAVAFLKLLNGLLDKHRRYSSSYYGERGSNLSWFAAAACAHAHEPERALAEDCWDDLTLAGGGLTLSGCLNKARATYDATRAREEAEQRARDEKRERLRTKPDALRAYLQEKHLRFQGDHLAQFGGAGETALHLLLSSTEPMNEIERDAFAALTRQLDDDPLDADPAPGPVPPTWTDTAAVATLVEIYRRRQRARIEELARRYGEGPALRRDREHLADGGLLGSYSWDSLEERARRDQQARGEQERLRLFYLDRRERQARRRKHEAGLAARLAHGRSAVYAIIDRDLLRICTRCDEIVYPPEPERRGTLIYQQPSQPSRCQFCGGSELAPWDPAYQSELEYGPGRRLLGSDLTSAAIDGLMDNHGKQRGSPVMRVCLYQRISTDEDHQPTSLKTQRERLERYCEAMEDWRIVAAHEDQASGTSLDRPGLQQALDLAREKRIDLLLVYRVDRLSRKVRQLAGLCEELDQLDVVLKSATEPFDTGSAAGRMMLQMLGVFAEFEHATIVDRVTAGLERRVREGKWMSGRTPYGYTRDKETKLLVPDPVKAPVVRRIFGLYADGKLGTTAIARTLEVEAAPPPRKQGWSPNALQLILANPNWSSNSQGRVPRSRALRASWNATSTLSRTGFDGDRFSWVSGS